MKPDNIDEILSELADMRCCTRKALEKNEKNLQILLEMVRGGEVNKIREALFPPPKLVDKS